VLTAGFGTRLDPITRLVAKAAVPLGGRTLIERVLDWLVAQRVADVVLNLHHLPETITALVGDGAHLGLRVRYSWEMPLLGSAGGPRHALPLLDADTFLIVNGDTLCDFALAPMIAAHHASGAGVTMAVVPNPAPERYNGIVLDEHDRVTGFVPKGHTTPSWHFTGVQVAQASVFDALPDGVPAESVHGIYPALTRPGPRGLRAHRVATTFMDVGTPRDYLAAALAMSGGAAIDPGALVAPGARVTGSVVWAGAAIGAHAVLDECIVTGVAVPPGFAARSAVLMPASLWQPGEEATVVGETACFPIDQ
jgi:mannose-1-phosphate guanylyltransferase